MNSREGDEVRRLPRSGLREDVKIVCISIPNQRVRGVCLCGKSRKEVGSKYPTNVLRYHIQTLIHLQHYQDCRSHANFLSCKRRQTESSGDNHSEWEDTTARHRGISRDVPWRTSEIDLPACLSALYRCKGLCRKAAPFRGTSEKPQREAENLRKTLVRSDFSSVGP